MWTEIFDNRKAGNMKNFQQKSTDTVKNDRQLHAASVADFMTRHLITFKEDVKIEDVIISLLENRITGAPVLNEHNEVVGMIDDKDCLNVLFGSAYYNYPVANDTIATYMTQVMKSISHNDSIVDAANIFLQSTYKRLLVMDDDGKLVGQISRRDILRAINELNANTW